MVKLKQLTKAKITVDRFGGYDHREVVADGAWYDTRNLSSDAYPLLTVRKNRVEVDTARTNVLAAAPREKPVFLFDDGRLAVDNDGDWQYIQLFPAADPPWVVETSTPWARIENQADALAAFMPDVSYQYDHTVQVEFVWNKQTGLSEWVWYDEIAYVQRTSDGEDAGIFLDRAPVVGDVINVRVRKNASGLDPAERRTLVSMGAYVCLIPDNLFVNVEKLAAGEVLVEGEDYGSFDNEVYIEAEHEEYSSQTMTLQMCNQEGQLYSVDYTGDTRPVGANDGDLWLDTGAESPTLRRWSVSMGDYTVVTGTCIKVGLSGIGAGFRKGDAAKFDAHLYASLWYVNGTLVNDPVLKSAVHALLKAEQYLYVQGDDFVVIPGILPEPDVEIHLKYSGDYAVRDHISLSRKAPLMDYVVEQGNRLWGCHYGPDESGQILNEIYACRLGDFKNWRVYQGLSTDSYTASRGSDGPYTGAAVLDGHPLFFKRNCVEKVFPSASGAHQIVTQTLDGVQQGSDRSLVVINDRLYYKTDHGVVCYTGAVPQYISAPLGSDVFYEASAARHLQKYCVAMHRKDEDPLVFVYDTERGVWHVETEAWYDQPAFTWHDRLHYISQAGVLMEYDAGDREGVRWYAESGILGLDVNQRKYISRINLRCRLELGSTATVFVQYNDSGVWQRKGTLWGNRRDTQTLVIWPRRCDTFRLRIEGVGGFALYSITYLRERGSDV